MTNWIFSLIDQFGYAAVTALIAIENIFPPIPSEIILSFGGFMTSKTKMKVPELILAATIGAVIGALILYWLGTLLTTQRLENLFEHRLFQKLGFKKEDIQRAINWFNRHGVKTIFYGRFIPVLRSLISIPAGTARVKLSHFIILTIMGSLIWNTILISLGAYMGKRWHVVVTLFEDYTLLIIGLILVLIVYAASYWYRKRIKNKISKSEQI